MSFSDEDNDDPEELQKDLDEYFEKRRISVEDRLEEQRLEEERLQAQKRATREKRKRFFAASYRRHGQLPNKTYIFCYNDLETPSFCTRSHATPFHVHAPAQPEYPFCVPACRSPRRVERPSARTEQHPPVTTLQRRQQPRNQIYGCQRTLE